MYDVIYNIIKCSQYHKANAIMKNKCMYFSRSPQCYRYILILNKLKKTNIHTYMLIRFFQFRSRCLTLYLCFVFF